MSDSPTGRGYTQGSDSYRADDVAREERERERETARKMRKALEMVRAYMKEEVDEIGVELLTPENRAIWDAVEDALKS